ncbi:uncharacterized protein LOC107433094 [Ziziphus jujuba]|uniref:Uncharacterized protein LOC107433094 n=1 Tax=Ziziphus jujuba TaxID=326968 RepID=A0A6P4BL59_ZIZJJ|nr:uncharacterized protein LOC107433094 [Ziziphus jujuba]
MEAPSFVSKARTAFHSAAAKAERVFSDLKQPDRDFDNKTSPKDLIRRADDESPANEEESKGVRESKTLRWRPPQITTKQDWQDKLRNIGLGRKSVEDTEKAENSNMSVPFYDENLYLLNMKNDLEAKAAEAIPTVESLAAASTGDMPPLAVIKQLAIAVEAGKKSKSMKDFLTSPRGSSPIRERASLSLFAMKSLVLGDKEDKLASEFSKDEKVLSLIRALFDADGNFLRRKISCGSEAMTVASFPREIHGAPPETLVVKLAEVIGNFKTLRKMALFWCQIVAELRRLWSEEQYVPSIPKDEVPDLNSCLLYQQLQVINCCLSRKMRRDIATQSVEFMINEGSSNNEELTASKDTVPTSPLLYARTSNGELVLRLGANRPSGDLTMLETGEPVYFPITQEGPLLTEDLIKENEEFVLRTGSVGAGCSQLLSDMQAFKAANPGCILEDFVRWHSPPDWTEAEATDEAKATYDGDLLSARGHLSSRMQKEGNLWRELWETSKPVPAVKQAPLFDEDLAVEGIMDKLEEIPASELFLQLFVSLLGLGFVMAEAILSSKGDVSKLFYECKDFVIATCQSSTLIEKVDDLCQVYETVEMMLHNSEEVLKTMKQPEDTTTAAGEIKRRFKRLNLNFGGKDRNSRKPAAKEQKNAEEKPSSQPFSSFFDGKSSLFSKKPPKPESITPARKSSPPPDDNDWTVV